MNKPSANRLRSAECCLLRSLLLCILFSPLPLFADSDPYRAEASPKPGWGDFEVEEEVVELPVWQQILLWPVNRVADAIDVFRVDAGVGTSTGGVVRITRGLQMGYRDIGAGSLRIGAMGRTFPIVIEETDEIGFAGSFTESKERDVCEGELALGADLFLAAHVGICLGELADFVAGIFFLDPVDDDIR